MNVFTPYLKAVGGFVAAVATNIAVQLQQGTWPTTWGDAARWVGSIVVTTYLVYRLPYLPKAPAAQAKPRAVKKAVRPTPGLGGTKRVVPPEHHGQHEKSE